MKLTKSALNKFIVWSSSRYNEWKKKDVVEQIYKGMQQGYLYDYDNKPYYTARYHAGSYCESSSCSRIGDYLVNFKDKTVIKGIIDDYDNVIREDGRLEFVDWEENNRQCIRSDNLNGSSI